MANNVRDIDRGFAAMLRRLTRAAQEHELTVGIHEVEGSEPKKESDGETGPATLAEIASYHEFGLGVPRRSFIADWADENKARHEEQLRKMAQAIVAGKVDSPETGLARLGALYVGEVQRRIAQGIDPPLAESTIKRKGSSKPLIDTGQLRTAITYYVDGKRTAKPTE
jgi:hypothetical protein